ncbi:MAG TPA: hypothetical protein VGE27_02625 [Gemmatimonas sp.]|uniref:DUF6931 family protein n=1 Tax=Gemmatimonas sp. TaxID=1962908 RepID=UPI002ED8884F
MTTPPVIAPDPFAAYAPPARWLLERSAPDDDALALLDARQPIEALYNAWIAKELFPAALRLIAAVLPARESVWWAWVSARHATQVAGGKPASAEVHKTLTSIEQWIVRPDDEARRAAWDAGTAAGMDTPVGMIAAAVFLSGNSVAPPHVPPVPPPPGAAMPLVAGAIMLSAASNQKAEQIMPTMSAFAAQGLEIVKRLGGWDPAAQLAYDTHQRLQHEYTRATAPAPPAR